MRVLFLGVPPQICTVGQKLQFQAKFSTMFLNGGLLFLSNKEYGKSKTIGFITDYLTIFTPNLVGVG